MFQPLSAYRRFALLTVLLCGLPGCQIPTDSRTLTAPRATQHTRIDLRDFRPSGAWLWDGPSECIRRDLSVPGEYDSATVYLFAIAAPTGAKLRSSVQLQYDRNKRLVLYQEHRDYALHLGAGSPTTVSVSTGYGRQHWRGGAASNYHFRSGVVTAEHTNGSAEAVFDDPRLGVGGALLRLTLDKCGAGPGFDRSLPPAPPPSAPPT